jgi:hypothetical protein
VHCKGQTRPLVREGAPHQQTRNCQTKKNCSLSPKWVLDTKIDWPTNITLTLTYWSNYAGSYVEEPGTSGKPSVLIAGLRAEIWVRDLRHSKQGNYLFSREVRPQCYVLVARHEVLTAVIWSLASWDVTPCSLGGSYQRFKPTHCLHL